MKYYTITAIDTNHDALFNTNNPGYFQNINTPRVSAMLLYYMGIYNLFRIQNSLFISSTHGKM